MPVKIDFLLSRKSVLSRQHCALAYELHTLIILLKSSSFSSNLEMNGWKQIHFPSGSELEWHRSVGKLK